MKEGRVRAIALESDAMSAEEAVALAGYLKVDAKGLLDKQTEDQLKRLKYVAPKKTSGKTSRASTTSPTRSSKSNTTEFLYR